MANFRDQHAAWNAAQDRLEARRKAESDREWSDLLERLRVRYEDPDYQATLAPLRAAEAKRRAAECSRQHERHMERQLARLSKLHVRYVRQYTGPGLAPREPLPPIWRLLLDRWDCASSALLVGPTETQKTTTATWAALVCACSGATVAHTTAIRVATATPEQLEMLRGRDLLLLDEIHRLVKLPAWKVAPVWDLIDYRHQQEDPTLGMATIDPGAIKGLAGGEVLRRFGLRLSASKGAKS